MKTDKADPGIPGPSVLYVFEVVLDLFKKALPFGVGFILAQLSETAQQISLLLGQILWSLHYHGDILITALKKANR